MKKVFITGATGFLGSHLCSKLVQENFEIHALCRSEDKVKRLPKTLQENVTWIKGDLFSDNWELGDYELIYHLAGHVGYTPADRALMEKVNVEGTQEIVNRIAKCNFSPFLIHLSSVVAIGAGKTPQEILNENSPFNMTSYNFGYFETKRKAEEIILNAIPSGLKAVMLNPSTIYGERDMEKGSRKAQLKVARGKLKYFPRGGVSVVHVDDVCKALLAAPEKGRVGERYILSGENITIGKLFETIAECAGTKAPRGQIPTWLLLSLGRTAEIVKFIFRYKKFPINYENLRVATLFHWFKHDKASQELGFHPRPAKEAINESVQWARENELL